VWLGRVEGNRPSKQSWQRCLECLPVDRITQKNYEWIFGNFGKGKALRQEMILVLGLFLKKILKCPVDEKHPFNSLFSSTTWVSGKVKPFWILTNQEMMGVTVASAPDR